MVGVMFLFSFSKIAEWSSTSLYWKQNVALAYKLQNQTFPPFSHERRSLARSPSSSTSSSSSDGDESDDEEEEEEDSDEDVEAKERAYR